MDKYLNDATLTLGVHVAKGLCEFEQCLPGPHPGCSEFAPSDYVLCNDKATVVGLFESHDGPDPYTTQLCAEHFQVAQDTTEDLLMWKEL